MVHKSKNYKPLSITYSYLKQLNTEFRLLLSKMEKSSPSKKGERKPGSKLSLQKKTRSTKAERNKALGAPATISLVDLNETCEFKDGKSLSMAWGGKGDAESVSGTRIGRLDQSLSLVTRKPVSGALIVRHKVVCPVTEPS